ncbi:MAG: hypothetical protein BWX80_02160 [Candidatus Hydrogenedentes bacterium ADurb.Bin101]|nr:MAG: hypothetical protein BWX80_02160 [Candidatus Hydrogenedentes bacterium ADurb.Bin101]
MNVFVTLKLLSKLRQGYDVSPLKPRRFKSSFPCSG